MADYHCDPRAAGGWRTRRTEEPLKAYYVVDRTRCFGGSRHRTPPIPHAENPLHAFIGNELVSCNQVIAAWASRVRTRWPSAESVPRCFETLILDGSRLTKDGWKVSYHLVYPWMTFPCNNSALKAEVEALAMLPQFQYITKDGSRKGFIDSSVYSRNRQFRLALSCKLSDVTQTPLRLPGEPSLSSFLLSCITRIEPDSWKAPAEEPAPSAANARCNAGQGAGPHRSRTQKQQKQESAAQDILSTLHKLLTLHGLPDGRLTGQRGDIHEASFRWGATKGVKWLCLIAQIWRPADPSHDSNGGIVSYDRSRAVFFQCLHPDCQRWSQKPGIFLGYEASPNYVYRCQACTAVAALTGCS